MKTSFCTTKCEICPSQQDRTVRCGGSIPAVMLFPFCVVAVFRPRLRTHGRGEEMKRILLPVFLPLLLTSALAQQTRPPQASNRWRYHPSRVLVRFRGAPQFHPGSGQARLLSQQLNLFLVDNPQDVPVPDAIAGYKRNPNVVYAEPDYQVQAIDTTPLDPMWSQQWDMTKIQAPTAWDKQTNAGDVVVAVVDTGIASNHPDLQANLWTDPVTLAHGFTCIGGTCTAGGDDDFGHGTHVAGTIGAASNGIGIAGINWVVNLMSMKFLDSTGSGSISDAVVAFNKIAELKMAGINIRVTNNSWGGGGYTQSLKDAMAHVESLRILDVCAARNNGANADVSPLYPAAYDNRGIVSIAASDSNDASAYFSNIGLASVDIAAPGVSTLSTVPTGTCSLCDPTGYKLLSGTSMATPHVTGVAAALFHVNPSATAANIRDVILNPASYDALIDSRLKVTTTTGGRLNFAKALNNPLLSSPTLNNFPAISPLSNITANSGDTISLTASGSDPDNDPLTLGWAPLVSASAIYAQQLNNIFPAPPLNTNPVSFTASSLARLAFAKYVASVADGRGGSASAESIVEIFATPNHGLPPAGIFTVSSNSIATGGSVNLNFKLTDPEGQSPMYWQAWFLSSNVWGEMCCLTDTTQNFNLTLSNSGVYRISVQGIDKELNLSPKYSDVVRVGGASGTPPIAAAVVDKLDGVAPLTVNIDMTGSSDPDGSIASYGFYCADGLQTSTSPQSNCVYNDPGTYYLWTTVTDNQGLMDAAKTYITVLPGSSSPPPPPPPPPDTTPPAVSITAPANGATVSGSVTVTASASDNVGVTAVTISVDGTTLCVDNTASYSCSWDTTTTTNASHTISATATDAAGNTGTAPVVSVTVSNVPPDTTPPTISITAPASGATVSGTVSVTASASDNVGVTAVTILIDGTTLCVDTTSPYSCSWDTTKATNASHTISATATDAAGNAGTAPVINVSVSNLPQDTTLPSTWFIAPVSPVTITGQYTVQVGASDDRQLSLIELFLDSTNNRVASTSVSSTTGTLTYKCNTSLKSQKRNHTLIARSTDAAGNRSTQQTVSVTVK